MNKVRQHGSLSTTSAGQVRIIGGQWRRHKIDVVAHDGLRPSSDRVRETVFNWMTHQWGGVFEGKSVLDAFAGSGAFGLECVSRGAQDVVMVDTYRPAVTAIQSTLKRWHAVANVKSNDILAVSHEFDRTGKTFDWIILDPPFGHGWLAKILPAIKPLIHMETWLYVEAEIGFDLSILAEHGWRQVRDGKTKQVQYGLYQRTQI